MTPAESLKVLRQRAGLTQAQLAEKAGMDRSQLNQMERGKRTIGPGSRAKLALALKISPLELGGEEPEDAELHRSLLDRLEELEAALADERRGRERAARAVTRRLAALEAALGLQEPQRSRRGTVTR